MLRLLLAVLLCVCVQCRGDGELQWVLASGGGQDHLELLLFAEEKEEDAVVAACKCCC